jgi:hypothetical protein
VEGEEPLLHQHLVSRNLVPVAKLQGDRIHLMDVWISKQKE